VFREAGTGFSCHNVTPLPTLFTTGYERFTEGGCQAFFFSFALGFLLFALGFWLLAFWYGKLLEGKIIAEGKRIANEGLIESLHFL
jgi:hypothetical protein